MSSKTPEEPRPPWVVSRSVSPADDPYWRTDKARRWLREVFVPFYDSLSNTEQLAYCNRWSAPTPWIAMFLHPDLDELAAGADAELLGDAPPPQNFRKILLSEP
jgi:hypothetical protein